MADTKLKKFSVVKGVIKGLNVKVEGERIISEPDDMSSSTTTKPKLVEKVEDVRGKLGDDIQYKFPKYFNRTVVLIIASLPLIALCIILVTSSLKFMKARKMGSMTKGECGKEYMERETQRYYIVKAYSDGVKRDLSTVNSMLLLSMFIIFLYLCFEGTIIYNKIIGPILEQVGTDANVENGWMGNTLLKKPVYYGLIGSSIIVVFSLWAASLSAWMDNKQLKHDTNMTNKHFKKELTGFMTFALLFCFIFFILFFFLGVKTDFLLLSMMIVGLYIILDKFTASFSNFHNLVIVPYQKYARDLNAYLLGKIKTDAKSTTSQKAISEKIKKYLIDKIKRVEPESTAVPDLLSPKYRDELYSYAMHKEGGVETFDESGSTSSVSIATFKNRFVELINANLIDKTNESTFNTQINTIVYNASATVPPAYRKYATGYYNIRMREQLVDLIYNDKQRNGVLMGSSIQDIFDKYIDKYKTLKASFDPAVEYPIYDDQNQTLRIGEFGTKSLYRILQEAHDNKQIDDKETLDDLMNIAMLKMANYDYMSVNLNTIDDNLDKIKDTFSYENTVSMYTVLDRFQKAVRDYTNANISDSQFGTMLSNLRSIDDSVTKNLDAMMKFMTRSTLLGVVIIMFLIFHKVYTSKYKDAMLLYLPLTLILLIIAVSWYAWLSGNLKV